VAWNSGFDSSAWTGASGAQIGYAGDYPETTAQGFTADPIHDQDVDPNAPNFAAGPGPGYDAPVILTDQTFTDQYLGADGWVLDDLDYPSRDTPAGTSGHTSDLGPAQSHRRDRGHAVDVYQLNIPPQYGVDFYGRSVIHRDLNAWAVPSGPPPNTRQMPAQSREDTSNWPQPHVAAHYAPMAPVVVPSERIPMRRPAEDDRPVYRFLAVPARNIDPSGSVFTPSFASNVVLQNRKPVPEMPRTPEDPWNTQEIASSGSTDEVDVFNGMGI
jgi:hypothetical protein